VKLGAARAEKRQDAGRASLEIERANTIVNRDNRDRSGGYLSWRRDTVYKYQRVAAAMMRELMLRWTARALRIDDEDDLG